MAKDKEGFEALIPFFMPEKANMAIRMRVSANGEVYISKKIIDSVRKENENMWVDFRHSEDYRTLAIRPGIQSGFRLPKTGTMKFHALRDILQNFGYAMPAWYFFEWDPEQKAWMGRLQEVSEAPLKWERENGEKTERDV